MSRAIGRGASLWEGRNANGLGEEGHSLAARSSLLLKRQEEEMKAMVPEVGLLLYVALASRISAIYSLEHKYVGNVAQVL